MICFSAVCSNSTISESARFAVLDGVFDLENFIFGSLSLPDTSKTSKLERYNSYLHRVNHTNLLAASSKLLFCLTLLAALLLLFFFTLNPPTTSQSSHPHRFLSSSSLGGAAWEKQVQLSATPMASIRVSNRGRRLCRHPLFPRLEKARRWRPRPPQLQLLLRRLSQTLLLVPPQPPLTQCDAFDEGIVRGLLVIPLAPKNLIPI
ncbi:hypothetical protein Scep_004012 [Stephania cephalantha]|uniref:Uncharacterized protein n=1 Tax=Stephania cephalantha TaxID=152367 RepID=A0AAP0KRL8_9MAGN